MRQEEGTSQLSAMFDGELAAAECELLSRRLGRDDGLRARWARYALIGAALRSEPVSRVSRDFSRRVGAAIDAGAESADAATRAERSNWLRTLASGTALAAGIAVAAVLVLRNQVSLQDQAVATAATTAAQRAPAPTEAANAADLLPAETLAIAGVDRSRIAQAPHDYVVPPGGSFLTSAPASLANYVAAHSEYSSPLVRGGLISRLVSAELPAGAAPAAGGGADDEVVIATK